MRNKFNWIQKIVLVSCCFFMQSSHSWDGHGLLFFYALNGMGKSDARIDSVLNTKVQAEDLNAFLLDTQEELPRVLEQLEQWSRKNEPAYRPTPSELNYHPKECTEPLENCFKRAIRINPKVPLSFYVQDFENQFPLSPVFPVDQYALPLVFSNSSLLPSKVKQIHMGDWISIKSVLSTHVDEPDFGLDINLYEDNPDRNPYGFGSQPIGLASSPIISQALFHMSTYQESRFIKTLSPRIQESFPAYRAHLYFALSQFAKQKGHLYWSARFAAWGFHYLQDLTQPYHSRLFPDYSDAQMALWFAENGLGIKKDFENAKQRISNRHTLAEVTLSHVISGHLPEQDRILNAIQEYGKIPAVLDCKDVSLFMRTVVSRNAKNAASEFSAGLVQNLPSEYVQNPDFIASDFTNYDAMYNHLPPENKTKLANLYLNRLLYFVIYSKQCFVDFVLN